MLTHYTRAFVLLAALAIFAGCDSASVPNDVGSSSTVSFTSAAVDTTEDAGSVTFSVTVNDPGFKAFSVELVRTGGSLSTSDIDAPDTMTIEFPESVTSGETRSFEIEIDDDDFFDEGDETITYELQDGNGVSIGDTPAFTLTVEDDDTIPADDQGAESIDNARAQALDADVIVRGIVTRKDGSNIFIQDDSGPTGASGIVVRDEDLADAYDAGAIQPGDRIHAVGELGAFSGLLQVSGDVRFYELERDSYDTPAPQAVTVDDLLNGGAEDYESELITITDLTVDSDGSSEFEADTNYDASDPSTSSNVTLRVIDDSFYVGESIPSNAVTYTGIVGQFNFGFGGARQPDTGYQLQPILDGDLE
ncbi:hypothetical protein [Longibacter sp.]|jgi:uncharacterized protein YdeI (BOF family)|uniref:hypothetical protein n=1 Tax=Longibacter sp. TaxID=2045415 RepID=UPI003EB7F30F